MWAAPDVFRYRDYRAFLRAFYALNKDADRGFSLRAFGKRARLGSSNYLKLVMDGQRNLSVEMAERFAEACGLRGQAAEYFRTLVQFNQAESPDARERAYTRLAGFRRYRKVYRLDRAQEAYCSHWYVPATRELAARTDFEDDPRWIARKLSPKITSKEAEQALATLLELGLLARDADGKLHQVEPLVQTQDGPLGHHVVNFHRQMLTRAAEALERVPRAEREIESLTLCLSENRMLELKARLEAFCEELLQSFQADEHSRRVVQVNVQMFPLSVKES